MADLLKIKQVSGLQTSIDDAGGSRDALVLIEAESTAESLAGSRDALVTSAYEAYADQAETDAISTASTAAGSRDALVVSYTDDAVGSVTTNVHSDGIDSSDIAGSNGSYTITLSTAMEAADAKYVQGVYINGLFTKFSVNSTTELAIATIGYNLDNQDTVVVKFNAAF